MLKSMGCEMQIEIEGFEELERALYELKTSTTKSVARRVLKKAARPVAERANKLAPVDASKPTSERKHKKSGDLSKSYGVTSRLNKNQPRYEDYNGDEVWMHVGTNDYSAVQQEFGNVNHPAQPHFRPAWDENKAHALQMVTEGMTEEVAKSVKRVQKRARR